MSIFTRESEARFVPSESAGSPWGPNMVHGGPVNGLLARALDRLPHDGPARIARVTTEILGAVTFDPVEVSARVVRPGRRIELLTAEMTQAGRPVARTTAWRLQTRDTAAAVHHVAQRLPAPNDDIHDISSPLFPAAWMTGFVAAVEWQVITPFGVDGPTTVWTRLNQTLVEGETTSPFETVMTICDVANGAGARLDPFKWTFLNTELTVHLHDAPQGDWLGLAAETSVGHDGIAMSSAELHSTHGPIGRIAQAVLVEALAA